MRLIDADAYMEKVRHEVKAMPRNEGETFVTLSEWIMEKTPSVKSKQGEWINRSLNIMYPDWERYTCSICGKHSYCYDFCPNCGSYNRGEQK